MTVTVDEKDIQLEFRKIPVIDLRYLSQDEINCAAQCSDEYSHLRFDDIVIPKIDRSVFNESAGSRKQTYSRLRFSQRNREQQLGNVSRRRAGLLSVSRHSNGGGIPAIMRQNTNPNPSAENGCELKDSNNNDNSQIMMLLKQLFMKGEPEASSICASAGDQTLADETPEDVLSSQVSDLPALNSASGSNGSSNSSAHNIHQNAKCEEERGYVVAPKVEDCSQLAESSQGIAIGLSGERLSANVVANEKVGVNVCDDPVIPLLSITNEGLEMKIFDGFVIPNAGGLFASIKNMPMTNGVTNVKVKTNCYDEIVIPLQSTKNEKIEMGISDGVVIPNAGGLRSSIMGMPIPNALANENTDIRIFDGAVIPNAGELSVSMQNMPISNALANEKMESNVCDGAVIPVQLTMNEKEEIKSSNGAMISNMVGMSAGFQDIPISNGVANEKAEINACDDNMIPVQSITNGKAEMEILYCLGIPNTAEHWTMDKEVESKISDTTAVPYAEVQSTMDGIEEVKIDGAPVAPHLCVHSVSVSMAMDISNIIVDENSDRPKKKLRTKEDARRRGQAIAAAQEQQNVRKMLGVSQDSIMEDGGCFDVETTTEVQDTKIAYDSSLIHKMSPGNMLDTTLNNNSQRDQNLAGINNAVIQGSAVAAESGCSSTEQFVPQLKRKFPPFETEAELHDFFEKVGGDWASKRKKRKIVDAEEFCEGFPKGWKLLLGVRKKEGRFLIECRKYISPDGQHLASCREVSAYMLSTSGKSPAVGSSQPPSCQSAELAQDYLKLTSSKPCSSMGPTDFSEGNHKDLTLVQNGSLFFHEEKQTSKRKISTTGMAEQNSRKDHDTPMKCSKCNVEFSNRSTFMGHLAVHHNSNNKSGQKEKKTSAAKSITDGVIIVDGKYECQICHKVFDERHRYIGHVGVHVRNTKKPQVSLGGTSNEAAKVDSTLNDIGSDKPAKDTNHDAILTSFSEHYNQQEQNANLFYGVLPDSSSPSVENELISSHDGHLVSAFDRPSTEDEPDYGSGNQKIDNLSGFEQFDMAYQPKFSFETGQSTNNAIDTQMELGLDPSVLHQEIDLPGEFGWESILARIENCDQHFVCVWCNSEFSHDGIDGEPQTGSLGFMCPVCKSKISGQVDM